MKHNFVSDAVILGPWYKQLKLCAHSFCERPCFTCQTSDVLGTAGHIALITLCSYCSKEELILVTKPANFNFEIFKILAPVLPSGSSSWRTQETRSWKWARGRGWVLDQSQFTDIINRTKVGPRLISFTREKSQGLLTNPGTGIILLRSSHFSCDFAYHMYFKKTIRN